MEGPYREESIEALRSRLQEAQREIEQLKASKRPVMPRRAVFYLWIGGSAVLAVHLFVSAILADQKDAPPFTPWHPWLALGLSAVAAVIIGIVEMQRGGK